MLSIEINESDETGIQTVYTDTVDDDTPDVEYTFELTTGQTISATAIRLLGNLDPVLGLHGPDGILLAENDDRDSSTLDAHIAYTVEQSGTYTLIVSNIRKTSGDFQLTVQINDNLLTTGDVYTGYMGDDVADDEYPLELDSPMMPLSSI